jgi:PAS domain S-box-containing protein
MIARSVSTERQAVVLNAVPLLVLAGVYLALAGALAPAAWRNRRGVQPLDWASFAVFPATGACALVLGGLVLHDRRPLGGHGWAAFAAILLALVPAVLLVLRWRERADMVGGSGRVREAERRVGDRDRELGAVTAITDALIRAQDAAGIGRVVADEVGALLGVDFVAIALVDDARDEATGLVARRDGADLAWWEDVRVDLRNEPSGFASAVFDGAPVQVYDTTRSSLVSTRLAEAVGAKSGAWIPMVAEARVIGVLVVATTRAHRSFAAEELNLLKAIAAEAGIALDRASSAAALAAALERERLVARISRRVRSELDVQPLLDVAVAETAAALGARRCFIRVGSAGGGPLPVASQWSEPGLDPVELEPAHLPVSNLAARDLRTLAVEDVETDEELEDETLGGRAAQLELGARAVLAVPLVVFDRLIGVLSIHRTAAHAWTQGEIELAEAVARELALALHATQLLAERGRRLEQQTALLRVSQALTSELELASVLDRLVEEVAELLRADAADCYLVEPSRRTLRCAAVHGLDTRLVGVELPTDFGLAGRAIAAGRPVLAEGYQGPGSPLPAGAYEGFARALVAPIAWSGVTRGVLGVGVRDASRSFGEADVELLDALAGLASLALRNAESYADRTRQAQIQRGFHLIAEVLGKPLSLPQTVTATAQAATQALGGACAAVLMPAPAGHEPAGSYELPDTLAEGLERGLPDAVHALATVAAERRVLASSRLAGDDRFDEEWRRRAAAAGFGALLAIPVETPRDDAAALVLVLFAGERDFADDDLDLARQVAGAAGGALGRAELDEAERSSRTLAQQLARMGSLLATELDPTAVLEEVVEQAPALLDVDAASILSLEGDELVVTAGVGDRGEAAFGARMSSTAWPAGDVVQSRAPVAVADVERAARHGDEEPVLAEGYGAYLGVPLYGRERALHGVLAVYALRPRSWREEEVDALAALAANASVALSNAELYQRVALEREQSVAILANIADGIVAVDRDGGIVLWNDAAVQITGVPREEAIGRTTLQVLHRELEAEGTGPGGSRLVSITRGGDEIWLSLSEAVMRDPVGAVAGRIFAFRDISSERAVEQMKSDFVSTVSHELRTPLTSIYGFAETLLRQDVAFGDEERRTFLGYIASESERLTAIVDKLLSVARLDTGDLQVQLRPTDVGAVVADFVSSVSANGEGNGHRFVVELDEGSTLTAEADAEKLRQVLDQLIQNAVEFSPEGGTVTVAARRGADAVRVSVVDEGIGIPSVEQQRIFSKFHRADAGNRPSGGVGLGLFIAQGLVAAMGGRIWVDSAEGEGSSFTFELPLRRQGD